MSRPCEICSASKPSLTTGRRIRRLLIEQRIVALCDQHASAYRSSGASTLTELQALFLESAGRRSLVQRRAPLDRRVFPARPEGRRRNDGRRLADRSE
jgi:hypothetical protein